MLMNNREAEPNASPITAVSGRNVVARRLPLLLIGLMLGGLMIPDAAQACSCLRPPEPWEARAEAAAVFTGTVTRVVEEDYRLRVTFRVDNNWKGRASEQVFVSTASSTSACGIPFREGREYIVYADMHGNDLSTNMCTRTAPLERASEDIEAFETSVFLGANYPEPFNPMTTIHVGLPAPADVSLQVYDRTGRLIETLMNGPRAAGVHRAVFDGSDLPSGVYLYRLQAGDVVETRSMVLLR
jgi:hypothetical protein